MITLTKLADAVHENAVNKGFHPEHESLDLWIANQCNNQHAEVSELWDAHRAGKLYELCDKADKMMDMGLRPLTNVEEELADQIIRALDQSKRFKINIEEAVLIKHEFNKTREYKHGKKN